jgi:4-hydroxybutyrate CoA-transferase
MGWQSEVGSKLTSVEDAVRVVKSGDRVGVGPFSTTPFTLCGALYERRGELENVRIDHPAGLFQWVRPEDEDGAFKALTNYATPLDRNLVNSGRVDYLPIGRWRADEVAPGYDQPADVFMVPVSPPDAKGYCSFGPGLWMSRRLALMAKTVIAEVHETFIRTGGENYIHVSDIDYFCEAQQATGTLPTPPRTEEETFVTEVICTLVASELVHDRDTVQIGVGTVSAAMGLYLGDKQDLGIQTELITGGIPALVQNGVATGKYKTLHREKVVGSACAALGDDELAMIDGHPAFELYDFGYTDDVRLLAQQDNLVAINNALLVDLTGQIASETIGAQVVTGVGGQTAFMTAAQYSRGGRSVTVTPSSYPLDGQRVSRIVATLPEGTVVTVPRTFVDYVVTEHGIASLRGKTVRERIGELIAVAHPDFQADLKKDAQRTYSIAV